MEEETKEHNHTNQTHTHNPSSPHFIHGKKIQKRKSACQTEVKDTVAHTPSEENYNYQDQNTTNAQMLATNLRLC